MPWSPAIFATWLRDSEGFEPPMSNRGEIMINMMEIWPDIVYVKLFQRVEWISIADSLKLGLMCFSWPTDGLISPEVIAGLVLVHDTNLWTQDSPNSCGSYGKWQPPGTTFDLNYSGFTICDWRVSTYPHIMGSCSLFRAMREPNKHSTKLTNGVWVKTLFTQRISRFTVLPGAKRRERGNDPY